MQRNTRITSIHTHENAKAKHISNLAALRRSVLACMLWEDGFYENGEQIADRIKSLCHLITAEQLSELAIEARSKYKLRHVSLLLARELARHPQKKGKLVGETIFQVIQRADELAEFLAIYWSEGKQPLSKQVKIGLARAFRKFNEYHFAKYNRQKVVKLRDVLLMVHPKPKNEEQSALYKKIAKKVLLTPDTWEVNVSAGASKKEVFERMLTEKKLGYMALLKNLRNMSEAGVDYKLISDSIMAGARKSKVLPFRFISAANNAHSFYRELDEAMQSSLAGMERLSGKTIVLVDVSGSMSFERVSSKSDLKSIDAACALAGLVVGICDQAEVFTFSNQIAQVQTVSGLGIIDKIKNSQPNGGTFLGKAVSRMSEIDYDRLIVITDEQSHDRVPDPVKGINYMINVSKNQNGVGYGPWIHVDGFSEAVIDWIRESEK